MLLIMHLVCNEAKNLTFRKSNISFPLIRTRKILPALFSCNHRAEIRSFVLLPTIYSDLIIYDIFIWVNVFLALYRLTLVLDFSFIRKMPVRHAINNSFVSFSICICSHEIIRKLRTHQTYRKIVNKWNILQNEKSICYNLSRI